MTETQELAVLIKMHRKAAGLSRIHLAEIAGVGKTAVYDIEKGKKTIQLDTLNKILKVLNIRMVFMSPLMDEMQFERNEKG